MARVDEKSREDIYREYVTEALRHISENTAKKVGGMYMKKRYADVIDPQKCKEERSGSEIADDIIHKLTQGK